ncbi:MAG: hypothetical protein GF411_12570 [Candidatus Lokiarchaeota archaeon]|nr:hypothetical protein [Candidatus Lokiarchaeota archaeon]
MPSRKGKMIISLAIIGLLGTLLFITFYESPHDSINGNVLNISNLENLIRNPSFEEGVYSDDGVPEEWHYDAGNAEYSWIHDEQIAHSGNRCLMLSNSWNEEGWENRPILYTNVQFSSSNVEERRFLLHLYTKSENVDFGSIETKVKYNSLEETLDIDLFRCSNETAWIPNSFVIETIPSGTTSIRVDIQLDNSPGTVWFDDIFLVELSDTQYNSVSTLGRFEPPSLGGDKPTGSSGETTHLEKIAGSWWLVNKTGHCFWSTSVVSAGLNPESNPYLWENLGEPNSQEIETYRGLARLMLKKDLACNTGYRDTVNGPTRNYIQWLNFGTEVTIEEETPNWVLQDHIGTTFGANGAHQFPDPFDAAWQDYVYQLANNSMPEWLLEREDFLGYWTDNEMAYGPVYKYVYSEACSRVLTEWLQGNLTSLVSGAKIPPNGVYETIGELNLAWSSNWHTYSYSSWQNLQSRNDPVRIRGWNDTRVMQDMYAFEREIYRAYCYHVIHAVKTAEDAHNTPHKLIISNRIAYDGPGYYSKCLKRVMDLFSDFDIIGINAYPDYNRMRTHYIREYLLDLEDTFYKTTKRPIIIGEFGVAAADTDVPIERWRQKTVNTQIQRGIAYQNLISQLFALPFTVGAHWFKWHNGYYSNGKEDPRNCGVIDDYGNYYLELKNHIYHTNLLTNQANRISSFSIKDFNWHSLYITIIDGT